MAFPRAVGEGDGRVTNLTAVLLKTVQDILICGLGETALLPCLGILLVSLTEPFRAIVEAVSERLMGAN